VLSIGLIVAMFVVTMASIAVQASTTPEPTVNPMIATMAMEKGACPQGSAEAMLKAMATEEATAEATSEATSEPAATVSTGVKCLYGEFSGSAEVSAPGAAGAMGFVFLSAHGSTGNLCYEVAVAHITLPATGLNIYKGTAAHKGTMVVSLHPRPDASGLAEGCVTADKSLVSDIDKNPSAYFINVATTDFKGGAARAQLEAYGTAEAGTGVEATAEATATS